MVSFLPLYGFSCAAVYSAPDWSGFFPHTSPLTQCSVNISEYVFWGIYVHFSIDVC